MTLTAGDARDEYTASSGQTVFNYTFKIYASTDLNVYQTPAGQECSDSDLITTYTVSGVGAEAGGTITLNSGATSGDLITIVSAIPTDRTVDYQNNGAFRPDTVNDDFDKSYSLIKQIEDVANRSLQFPQCLQGATSLSLPAPVAGNLVRWKNDVSGLENVAYPANILNVVSEDVAVVDGQLSYSVTTGGLSISGGRIELAKGGSEVDGTLLVAGTDYTVTGDQSFDLLRSYPGGVLRVSNTVTGLSSSRPFINVKDYGAVGNGVNDDTAAITSADQAAALVGGLVWFPSAVYMATTLNQTAHWEGVATIKQLASTSGNLVTAFSNTSIKGLTLDGNKANQTSNNFGYAATDADNVLMTECTVKDCYNGSLKLKGISNFVLANNTFKNGGTNVSAGKNEVGIDKSATNICKQITITGNVFEGAAIATADNVALIMGSGCRHISVTGNAFSNYESEVIQVLSFNSGLEDTDYTKRPAYISIAGNTIDGSSGSAAGVHIGENCDHVNFTGNTIYGADIGIKIGQWVEHINVIGNVVGESVTSGCTISGKAYGDILVNSNTFTLNGSNGVLITGAASDTVDGIVISNNICKNNGAGTGNIAGIRVASDCLNVKISGNVCTDDRATKLQPYGITLESFSYTNLTLENNDLRGNLTDSALVNASRYSFAAINNQEGSAPQLYNATFTYGPIVGGGTTTGWTSPNANFDGRRKKVVFYPDNPGSIGSDSGAVAAFYGQNASNRDTIILYNPTVNNANGTAYVYFEE